MPKTVEGEQGRREHVHGQASTDGLPVAEDEVTAAMMEAFRLAGTPPDIVYAAQKTGRIVTVENQHLLSADELAEWNAAVAEYRQQQRGRRRWRR